MALHLVLNGKERNFDELAEGCHIPDLVQALGFRPDRVAIERNGQIIPRTVWAQEKLNEGDRLEVVHFVGGGCCQASSVSPVS